MKSQQVEYSLQHTEWSELASVWRFVPENGTVLHMSELPAVIGAPDARVISIRIGTQELLKAPVSLMQLLAWYRFEYWGSLRMKFPAIRAPERLTMRCDGYIAQIRIFGHEEHPQ